MFKIKQFKFDGSFEWSVEIPENAVNLNGMSDPKLWINEIKGTLAITIRSDRLLETSLAMSIGLVSQLVPLRSEPSGKVTVIS